MLVRVDVRVCVWVCVCVLGKFVREKETEREM